MVVHIVMAVCAGDSYHQPILATVDKEEALETVNDYNRRHRDPYDIQYEMFPMQLKGLPAENGIQIGNNNTQVNAF